MQTWKKHKKLSARLEDNHELLDDSDPEIRQLAREDSNELQRQLDELEEELRELLTPNRITSYNVCYTKLLRAK